MIGKLECAILDFSMDDLEAKHTIEKQLEDLLSKRIDEKEFRDALASLLRNGLLKMFQWNKSQYVKIDDYNSVDIKDLWFEPTVKGRKFVEENYDRIFPAR